LNGKINIENKKYCLIILIDLLHLLEHKFDRKRISANPSSNPKPNSNPNEGLTLTL